MTAHGPDDESSDSKSGSTKLEQDLLHTKTQAKTIATERDELRLQLEHGEANLALLTDRLQAGKERGNSYRKSCGLRSVTCCTGFRRRI